MAHTVETHRIVDRDTDRVYVEHDDPAEQWAVTIARLINLIGGVIMALLSLRFGLMLLGANQGKVLVDLIYTLSAPFAAPFFGMFDYQQQFGRSRFEYETIIAIIVYALLTWALVKLVTLATRRLDT